MQFATNHLGHFALALGLHEALAAAGDARVVSVSSSAHLRSPVVFDDIQFNVREYDPVGSLRAVEDRQRAVRSRGDAGAGPSDGITVNALMPGAIRTGCSATYPMRSSTGCAGRAARRRRTGRRPSREPRHRCCWPPRRCSTASAAATSKTATRLGPTSRARGAASQHMRWTPTTRRGCGTSHWRCSASRGARVAQAGAGGRSEGSTRPAVAGSGRSVISTSHTIAASSPPTSGATMNSQT